MDDLRLGLEPLDRVNWKRDSFANWSSIRYNVVISVLLSEVEEGDNKHPYIELASFTYSSIG